MRILVVEDDAGKRGAIKDVLFAISGVERESLHEVSTSMDARRELETSYFDLLILDIALPRREGDEPRPDEGLLLLEEIAAYPVQMHMPAHIVGITAYADIYARAVEGFSSRLLTLIHYDHGADAWARSLSARVKNILSSISAREDEEAKYRSDLGIVCALDSPELQSILAVPWGWTQVATRNDHTIYWEGKFRDSHGHERSVFATSVGRMGMPNACVIAMKLIQAFRPRCLAMTGMAAGVRGKVNVGDVIVADPSWDWGNGKWITVDGDRRFLAAPHQIPLGVRVRDRVRQMSRDGAVLGQIRDMWPGEKPPNVLAIRVGPLASGSSVLADGQTAERILDQHRELLGIDMEAYGVLAAAAECSDPQPSAIALKSVVDFAGADKSDRFQAYACHTSAQVLKHFAETCLDWA